jgi:TrmH family RNA methyltransferase
MVVAVQDPGNLGAVARVAEAAGMTRLVVAGQSADPFSWKALRGSMGSALRLPIDIRAEPAAVLDELRRQGTSIVAAAPRGGRPFFEVDYTGETAIVIGGEGRGLPPALSAAADELVTIPMQPPVESLNTAIAAALLAYEARRQRACARLATGHR